jgi:lauroyl/myristoyl acyltransferase
MSPNLHTGKLAYRLGYTASAFSVLSRFSSLLGRRASGGIGAFFAKAYCATQPGVVRTVADNLRLLDRSSHTGEATRVFENYARTLADYFWLADRSGDEAFALADIEGTMPVLTSGAILATGHYGFFEFGALVLTRAGLPVSVVTDAEPTSELTRWRAAYRKRWGAETIELGGDAFASLRAAGALEAGRLTAMLVDRPVGGRALPVELPGGVIPFSMAPAILSWMTGCPVIPVSVRRTAAGRYVVRTGEPVSSDRATSRDRAIEDCTRRIADTLVRDFLSDPLQWYQFIPLAP